jgi:hypothetical protein
MAQYEPSVPYEFVNFFASIEVTITPCSGIFRPSNRAKLRIFLDEKPYGRPVSPRQNTSMQGTYEVDINQPSQIEECFRRLLGDGVIRPDAALVMHHGARRGFFPGRRYSPKLIDRHRSFLGRAINQICRQTS